MKPQLPEREVVAEGPTRKDHKLQKNRGTLEWEDRYHQTFELSCGHHVTLVNRQPISPSQAPCPICYSEGKTE